MSAKSTVVHLNFRNQAREALHFYQSVFGGEIAIATYADAGRADEIATPDAVIWGQVKTADGFHVMAFDISERRPWHAGENAFFVAVAAEEADEVAAIWNKLGKGGSVVQPIGPSPWSPLYGMVKDRFGITWILSVASTAASDT